MSDRLGMIHAIHESPGDDLPRLAYADWLEERGEVDHAEFVRVELALSHLDRDDPSRPPIFQRELELIRAHKDEWFGTWRSQWTHYEIRCGFIEELSSALPGSVVPHADWLFSHHSLLDLAVSGPLNQVRPLLHHPLAGIVARLRLDIPHSSWSRWESGRPERLPLAKRPLVLSVAGHRAGADLIDDLLASPHLARLSWLNVSLNAIGESGIRRLLDGLGAFPQLTTLRVAGLVQETGPRRYTVRPNIDAAGVILLADHPAAARLKQLDLANNGIEGAAVQALIDSPHLECVERLNIGRGPSRAECRRLRRRFGDRVELPSEEGG